MKLDLTVFNQDVSGMKVFELADWLEYCQNQVKRENFDTDSQYYETLKTFCDEWERHYEKNKDFYERKEFAFALMYVTVKNNAVLVTKFKGGEHRCSIGTCKDLENITNNKNKTIDEIEKIIREKFAYIKKIVNEK